MPTLVIDPLGTPEPLFLRSGIAQVDVAAAHHPSVTPTPAPIPLVSDHMIVIVSATENELNTIELPENASIGVLVEVYLPHNRTVDIYPASGDNIDGVGVASGRTTPWFRKTTATTWRRIGS